MSSLISTRLVSDTIRAISVDLVPPAFTRLEPQSVSGDPAPGLEARIHDPLWMLARQWQFGEFHGEDSGTPIAVHVSTESSNPTQWQPGDPAAKLPAQPLSDDAILDALVEREPGLPEGPGLRLRAESGAQLLDDLADAGVTGVRDALIAAFPLSPPAPADPFDLQAPRLATLLTGLVPDAESIARDLEGVGGATPPWTAAASKPATASKIAAGWLAWYRGVSPLPDPNSDSWIDDRLEYRFGVTLDRADQPALRATSFNGGRVDWYAFDSDVNPPQPSPNAAPPVSAPARRDIDLVATPLRFAGMPSNRYWQFEDGAVNLGMLQSQPHDLARLCLVEFAMVYGNDWLVVPVDIQANAFTTITDVSYTTTFGERIPVPSPDDSGRSGKFQMFSITASAGKALPGIFLPPSGQSPQEGQPLEEVLFLRDEAAAMSWAVERFVQGPSGDPRNRGDEPRPAPILPSTDPGAELDYILATQVPDNWIPFVTIALGQNAIALRKGAMVKAGAPVLARGVLLRPTPFTIQDQEVPREGVRVRRIPVLARHADGSYERWIGRRVLVGRGEGSSGLLFDSAIRRNAPRLTQAAISSATDTETSVTATAPALGQTRLRLKAFRFRYDTVLEACLNGEHRILVVNPAGPFESGRHIRKIQQALLDLGYSLPIHGADSTYGPETAAAVSQFKTDQKISPDDGVVGPQTMAALDAIFVEEPSPFSPPPSRPGDVLLDDFIEALQDAASANSADTDAQFLTRLRQLYYPGTDPDGLSFREVAFDRLLPDAPFKFADGSRRILTPAGMNPLFFARLAQHAPENPTPAKPLDNPSPYLIDATGSRVDIGHVLLTLDALLHPRAASPYSDFGVPAIDPASWIADLGIAAVWTEQNGVPDAPRVLPPLVPSGNPDFDGYFAMSAPDPDLLGDVDGFNIASSWLVGQSLSSAIIRYYVDGDTAPGVYRQRFRTFMTTLFGTFDPDAPTLTSSVKFWTPRVDRFNDLFAAGAIGSILSLTPPPPKSWQFSADALAKFFQWLISGEKVETDRFD